MSLSYSHTMAQRQSGVCRGTLFRQCAALSAVTGTSSSVVSSSSKFRRTKSFGGPPGRSPASVSANRTSAGTLASMSPSPTTSARVHEYCVLVGVQLSTYESLQSYDRGDYPIATFTVVGATSATAVLGSSASSSATSSSTDPTTFRLVTNQGTQVTCTAPTRGCRDVWLSAFQAGLEGRLNSLKQASQSISPLVETANASNGTARNNTVHGTVPGNEKDDELLPKLRPKHFTQTPSRFCRSCGKVERLEFPLCARAAPLPAYGLEERCDLCKHCLVSQGILDQAKFIQTLYASASQERNALLRARELLWAKLVRRRSDESLSPTSSLSQLPPSEQKQLQPQQQQQQPSHVDRYSLHYHQTVHGWLPSDTSPWLFEQVLQSAPFIACKRISPILEALCHQYLSGIMGLLEFLEQIDQSVGSREGLDSQNQLKKQAFRMAGDMGTAIKLLLEHALPDEDLSIPGSSSSRKPASSASTLNGAVTGTTATDTDMLQCILEFFLELAADGELQSLAFFFPQICAIHLRMLPPTNHAELLRVELVEDFLLTICCKYSVQLAIELIWTHLADLEDAWTVVERALAAGTIGSTFASSSTSSASANVSRSIQQACRRRFAVLRFLCELESLLFDFSGGWGGGSVTVGHLIQPSKHQVQLLKQTVKQLQRYRRINHSVYGLSQSTRIDNISDKKRSMPMDQLAVEALRVTKNADYLSSHLVFTKRLCDIAEKLRFLNVSDRAAALQSELVKLNASGSMGGDPLNSIQEHLSRVVRVPITEGHVFRSKERTPVLLLMEVLNEGPEESAGTNPKVSRNRSRKMLPNGTVPNARDGSRPADATNNAAEDDETAKLSAGERQQESNGDSRTDGTEAKNEKTVANDGEEVVADRSENTATEHDDTNGDSAALQHSLSEDDDEFHSAAGSIEDDIAQSNLETPRFEKKVMLKIDSGPALEGSITEEEEKESKHALRRFDSPKGSVESAVAVKTPSREVVEQLVTSVVTQHLQLPELRMSDNAEESKSPDSKTSGETDTCDDKDPITSKLAPRPSPDEETETADTTTAYTQSTAATSSPADGKIRPPSTRKLSSLGTLNYSEAGERIDPSNETRRKVLDTIMRKGGSHTVAASVSTAAQRSLQELERRRAVALLLKGNNGDNENDAQSVLSDGDGDTLETTRQDLLSLGISSASSDNLAMTGNKDNQPTEEDEVMEAIRLLLVQYRVAQGQLSLNAAAESLASGSRQIVETLKTSGTGKEWPQMKDPREMPQIDSGDIDSRLAGCGILPPAVLQALTLWKGGMVSNGELLELVKKDLEYVKLSLALEESRDKLIEDSAFWGRFAFGERWAEKRSRIAATSPQACKPGWDLLGVIVKSNDDLRQEAFVMQLIELCREAFNDAGVELWLHPYRILPTGRTTGIIEMVRNAMSFDALKKRPGYGSGGLRGHLRRMTEFSANPQEAFKTAQTNFVRSLAAYSLLSYLFLFKDRHNGNILLDTAGHVIHIDFGFVFGIAPGGSFSLEMSTPFKLTEEMIEVMDGVKSTLFSEFVTLFCCGFLALQAHCDTFLTIVDITCSNSTFKCFDGKPSVEIVQQLRDRFRPDLDTEETIAFALDLIKDSTESYGTTQYDYFQYLSQGIAT